MATTTKTFTTNVTVHVPAKDYKPKEITPEGFVIGGTYKVEAIPPGDPVTLPADEADLILDRHGGEEIEAKAPKA